MTATVIPMAITTMKTKEIPTARSTLAEDRVMSVVSGEEVGPPESTVGLSTVIILLIPTTKLHVGNVLSHAHDSLVDSTVAAVVGASVVLTLTIRYTGIDKPIDKHC